MSKTGNDHQFCGDAILTLIAEVKRLQFDLGVARGESVALSPAASALIETDRVKAATEASTTAPPQHATGVAPESRGGVVPGCICGNGPLPIGTRCPVHEVERGGFPVSGAYLDHYHGVVPTTEQVRDAYAPTHLGSWEYRRAEFAAWRAADRADAAAQALEALAEHVKPGEYVHRVDVVTMAEQFRAGTRTVTP